jgi:hypothetical protein
MKTQTLRASQSRSIPFAHGLACAIAAFLAAFVLWGCATSEVSNHTFLHEARAPRLQGALVEIFTNGLPARPFERVAILDVHCEAQFFADRTIQNAIPLLMKEARAAGCDAVVEIQEAKTPENWTLETKVKHYTGVGVAYK